MKIKLEWLKDLIFAVDYLHLHKIIHKKVFPKYFDNLWLQYTFKKDFYNI